jgi:hypothetical protein
LPAYQLLNGFAAVENDKPKEADMTTTFSVTAVGVVALVGIGCSTARDSTHGGSANGLKSVESVRSSETGWQTAQLTNFTSYPACCPDSPVYDPSAPRDECDDFSGCKYMGDFAAIGHQSFDYVKSHDLVAFYDDADPNGTDFYRKYGGKTIQLRKGGNTFSALIADTCGNGDCNGCCSRNSRHGFLVDMEYWTTLRQIGGPDNADGTIEFQISN